MGKTFGSVSINSTNQKGGFNASGSQTIRLGSYSGNGINHNTKIRTYGMNGNSLAEQAAEQLMKTYIRK